MRAAWFGQWLLGRRHAPLSWNNALVSVFQLNSCLFDTVAAGTAAVGRAAVGRAAVVNSLAVVGTAPSRWMVTGTASSSAP